LIKLLPCILFEKYINILALEMASVENWHCADCIGALSFPIAVLFRGGSRCPWGRYPGGGQMSYIAVAPLAHRRRRRGFFVCWRARDNLTGVPCPLPRTSAGARWLARCVRACVAPYYLAAGNSTPALAFAIIGAIWPPVSQSAWPCCVRLRE